MNPRNTLKTLSKHNRKSNRCRPHRGDIPCTPAGVWRVFDILVERINAPSSGFMLRINVADGVGVYGYSDKTGELITTWG